MKKKKFYNPDNSSSLKKNSPAKGFAPTTLGTTPQPFLPVILTIYFYKHYYFIIVQKDLLTLYI